MFFRVYNCRSFVGERQNDVGGGGGSETGGAGVYIYLLFISTLLLVQLKCGG